MVIYYLFITVLVLMLFSYWILGQDILVPPFVVCATFSISILCAICNIDNWSINLSWLTYWVIVGGIAAFIFAYTYIYFFMFGFRIKSKKFIQKDILESTTNELQVIYIRKYILLIFAIFEIIVAFLLIREISTIALNHGFGGSLANRIYGYRKIVTYTDTSERISSFVMNCFIICNSAGYVLMYILINNYLSNKKINKLLLLDIVGCASISMLLGMRGYALRYFAAAIVMFYIIWNFKNSWKLKIRIKTIVKAVVLCCIVAWAFIQLQSVLGRSTTFNIFTYLSVYLGAPIQLLDMFLGDSKISAVSQIWGNETFPYIINWLSTKFNVSEWSNVLDLEFRFKNGQFLGNVYTAFRPYYHDFGYIGVIVLSALAGAFYSIIYNSIKYSKQRKSRNCISIKIVFYSYMYYSVIFMFFSNSFYEQLINSNMIKIILFFYITRWMFSDNLKNKKHVILGIKSQNLSKQRIKNIGD